MMVFSPTASITSQIAEHLAQQIICGELVGGARVQELKVAQQLDVSRGSVREALLILQRQHLIDILPRRGAVVRDLSARDTEELVSLFAVLEADWLPQLMRSTRGQQHLCTATVPLKSMEAAAREQDVAATLQARTDYYRQLLAISGVYTNAVFDCLLPSSQRLMFTLIRQGRVDLHDVPRYYRALHDALVCGDQQRVQELLRAFHGRLSGICRKMTGAGSCTGREASWAAASAG